LTCQTLPDSVCKYYFATDALHSPDYRTLLPEDLLDPMIEDELFFDPDTETGVLFHMIGACPSTGSWA